MTVNEKVEALRKEMKKAGLEAWIINGTDPHESEYVCPRWRSREWISGFTGSAGTVVITMEKALLWVDSRYFVQCADQIKGTCFEMRKSNGPEASNPDDFLIQAFKNNEKIGISAETLMVSQSREYKEKGLNIVACDDILEKIWTDRPAAPSTPVNRLPDKNAGETVAHKIERIREKATEDGADWVLIASLDDIAWTLNLRSGDIENTPVFLSYLLIGKKEVKLFTSLSRFAKMDTKKLPYEILDYCSIGLELSKITGKVVLNPKRINMLLFNALSGAEIIERREYTTLFKAMKNPTELEGMRIAHLLDGVAMVNFLSEVKSKKHRYTEVSIAEALSDERSLEESYLGPSFETIAGFADHGAVVHYSANAETDKKIKGNGLLVLDSGGQYVCGTTDITRTILFGKATKEQKEDYTLVLKGHLALASQVFPKGTNGHQLDVLAHQFLWNAGMNYFHGTGHGVGHVLSVHEGPQNISASSKSAEVALEKGMVLSDEPGLYKEGKYGIRIENLVAVTDAIENEFGTFYTFETLTCCPYERDLILTEVLTFDEIDQINTYHEWIYRMLKDMVNPSAVKYLREATLPLEYGKN